MAIEDNVPLSGEPCGIPCSWGWVVDKWPATLTWNDRLDKKLWRSRGSAPCNPNLWRVDKVRCCHTLGKAYRCVCVKWLTESTCEVNLALSSRKVRPGAKTSKIAKWNTLLYKFDQFTIFELLGFEARFTVSPGRLEIMNTTIHNSIFSGNKIHDFWEWEEKRSLGSCPESKFWCIISQERHGRFESLKFISWFAHSIVTITFQLIPVFEFDHRGCKLRIW